MIKQEYSVIPDRYASFNEHESLKAEIIMCPAGAYLKKQTPNKTFKLPKV